MIFTIGLHNKDIAILDQIKSTLRVEKVYKHGENSRQYTANSLSGLVALISHFDKYPLITQKRADYLLFKLGVNSINNKEHLTTDGFRKIMGIRASMNLGLSNELKVCFSDIISISRPLVQNFRIPNPYWLDGFISGEGCFLINLSCSSIYRTKFQVKLVFSIS